MDYKTFIIDAIECHAVEDIATCFRQGVDPNMILRGEPLIYELTSEYARSPKFKQCVQTFIDAGLKFEDEMLLAILLDNVELLLKEINRDPSNLFKKRSLRCAYTPLFEASLLHICAEFNHTECAKILIDHGADVNAKAGLDEYGFGGQTPIFHTVNQNRNQSAEMMDLLLLQGADLSGTVKGIIWGKSYEWETFIPAVNPISYAMMGMLPQMHRNEITTSEIVRKLMKHQYGLDYTPENVPCTYLKQ